MALRTPATTATRVLQIQLFNADGKAVGQSTSYTATIAAAGNLSGAANLGASRLALIIMPAAWDTAALTFQVSADNVTYHNLYDDDGTEVSIASAVAVANRALRIELADWIGVRYLKVRSGTSGTPVAQAAERVLTLVAFA